MNEAAAYTCPMCRRSGAGVLERRTVITESDVVGTDPDSPSALFLRDGADRASRGTVYVCAACRTIICYSPEEMARRLAENGN